jgi:hypothetical protein
MTDKKNVVSFSAYLLSAEAGLQYQPGPDVPISIDLGGSLNYGIANAKKIPGQEGRLPIVFKNLVLSVDFWI